jgi:cell division protein FtsZ
MITQKLEGVEFIVANTDAQALENSKTQRRIQLGLETTKGLGAGARPEIGKLAAEEAIEDIERELDGANMVFITAGMGGGTGSGAAPVVAKIAKEKGILTVGVVTKPFQFEGKKRSETADRALENFTKEVDSIIVIPNQNLFRIADKNTKLSDAFIMADNVLYDGVRSITDLMIMPGLINLDFADVKAIMEDKGKAIMGTGEAEGEDRAVKAAEQALSNPLLDDCSMKGAKGVLINITASQDITLMEVDDAVNRIKEEVDEDANIIFGSSFDASLEGKIRVSIVATGIDDKARNRIEPVRRVEQVIVSEPVKVEEVIEEKQADSMEDVLSQLSDNFVENVDEKIDYAIEREPIVLDEPIEKPVSFRENMFEDFDNAEKSDVISDMPNSTSLFKAFINKQDEDIVREKDLTSNQQIAEAIDNVENHFVPKTALVMPNKEPELFPNHNPSPMVAKREEELEEFIPSDSEPRRRSFIDLWTNRSIAKRNKQKQDVRVQEPITPSFSDDVDDKVNLEIPSFLRRR